MVASHPFSDAFPLEICPACQSAPSRSIHTLLSRLHLSEAQMLDVQRVCASCTGSRPDEEIKCDSIECSWLYQRRRAENEVARLRGIRKFIEKTW